jgi:hypothetical protein
MLVELQLLSFAKALCRYSAEASDTYVGGCKYLSFLGGGGGRNIISNLSYNTIDLWPEVQAVSLRVLYFCFFNSIKLWLFLSSLFCQHDSITEFYFLRYHSKSLCYISFSLHAC